MNLSEFLAARVVLEVLVKHVVRHLLRSRPVNLEVLLSVRVVGVQPSELTFSVSEQDNKMWTV